MFKNNRVFIILLLSFFVFTQAHAEKRILKWVDSKGVIHYGDQLPPTAAGNSNQVMNKQGITVKRNIKTATSKEDESLKNEQLAQQRKDNILLASYTTVEEIDLARNRNLEMKKTTLQALKLQKENVDERAKRNNIKAESFQAKNKPLPDYLKEEISIAKAEAAKFTKEITDHEKGLEDINKHYDAEKSRFTALKHSK